MKVIQPLALPRQGIVFADILQLDHSQVWRVVELKTEDGAADATLQRHY